MKFFSSSSVGLYLEGRRIYVAELREQFGETQITRTAQSETVLTATNPTPDEETVSRSIAEIFQRESIRHKDVTVALTEKESMVRYFEMPVLPSSERRDSVRFEAQKYLPFDIRELFFDYSLQIDKTQNRMKVTCLAAKKESVNRIAAIVRGAGLRIKALEAAPMAMTRALYAPDPKSGDAFAILDIDKKGFINIFIVKNDLVVMTRDHVYFKSAAPDAATEADFKSCVSEVRLSLNYFSKNFKNENLSRIVLGADLKEMYKQWDSMLEGELGIPVRAGNPLNYFSATEPYSSGVATAIGLAMRGSTRARGMKLNLNPKVEARAAVKLNVTGPRDEADFLKKTVICELLFVLIFGGLVYSTIYSRLEGAKRELARQVRTIPADRSMSVELLNEKTAALTRRIDYLTNLTGRRLYVTQKMNSLAKILPPEIWISSIHYNDIEGGTGISHGTMSIDGTILSRLAGVDLAELNKLVASFAEDPEFMKGFSDVRIVSAQNVVSNNALMTKFVISCTPKIEG